MQLNKLKFIVIGESANPTAHCRTTCKKWVADKFKEGSPEVGC